MAFDFRSGSSESIPFVPRGRAQDQDDDNFVGGELISPTAQLLSEQSSKPAAERDWLSAISQANSKKELPLVKRLVNVRRIVREALQRGILTEDQVNTKLNELKIGVPTELTSEKNPTHIEAIKKLAQELALLSKGLNRQDVLARPLLLQRESELQAAVNRYKAQQLAQGLSEENIRQTIMDALTETGLGFAPPELPVKTEIPLGPDKAEPKLNRLPEPDYEAIAWAIPLDEKSPRRPDTFIQPIISNMFQEDDTATLAGRVVGTIYDSLVTRPEVKPFLSDEMASLLETSKRLKGEFMELVERINAQRTQAGKPPLELALSRTRGKDGFNFNGSTFSGSDFLFYFGRSKSSYKRREPEIRAYITLSPEDRLTIQEHFVELSLRLYDAGVDFSAKASSLFGVTKRTDNMVFYISISDQPNASQLIKSFLQEKGLGQGHLLSAVPSPQEGLSWAMEPSPKEMELWKKISGSSNTTSYNVMVAVRAMPTYLDRLAEAHKRTGDLQSARTFTTEAERIRSILQTE